MKKIRLKPDSINVVLSLLPVAILVLLILFYPLVNIFFHSFTKWTIAETTFVGLGNYKNLFVTGNLLGLLKNNLILFLAIPIQIFISLLIAYTLYSEIWWWKTFRILFYLPSVLSVVVIGYLFRMFFALNGPLNSTLRAMNLDFLVVDWFSRGATAFIIIIIALMWHEYGVAVLIFLSGMSIIEPSVLESAKIDGANWWRRFIHIIIPMIVGTIEFYLVILLVGYFTAIFGFIFSITAGGPGFSTTTLDYMIYIKAFKTNMLGQASALAVILFLIVLIIIVLVIKVFRKYGEWQE